MPNEFTIQEKLPSLNEYTNANRRNRYAGANFKEDVEKIIGLYIQQGISSGTLKPMGDTPCEVYIDWYEKTKRRDVDNIQSSQKFILDALQENGVLIKDSRKYVKQVHHMVYDADLDYVVVRLEPYGSNGDKSEPEQACEVCESAGRD